jgi:hypothetical protein
MRSFLIAWLVAFGLVALGASMVGWLVGRAPPPTVPADPRRPSTATGEAPIESGPFTQSDAVQVVSLRLPAGAGGDAVRRRLLTSATVTYYSYQHWRVCFDTACWIAHGPGRYAEPENDVAHRLEGPTSAAP